MAHSHLVVLGLLVLVVLLLVVCVLLLLLRVVALLLVLPVVLRNVDCSITRRTIVLQVLPRTEVTTPLDLVGVASVRVTATKRLDLSRDGIAMPTICKFKPGVVRLPAKSMSKLFAIQSSSQTLLFDSLSLTFSSPSPHRLPPRLCSCSKRRCRFDDERGKGCISDWLVFSTSAPPSLFSPVSGRGTHSSLEDPRLNPEDEGGGRG